MSFDVYFGTTNKRVNSTLRPSYDGWHKTAAVWKQDKDIDRPTITIYYTGGYPQWNYMYIPVTHGYYWITGIVSVRNNSFEISGAMDILATYKSDIISTKCYIEYGFNTDASGNKKRLRDSRQNVAEAPKITAKNVQFPPTGVMSSKGIYILSVTGSNGSTMTYGLDGAGISKLTNNINKDASERVQELATLEDIMKFFTTQNVSQGSAIQSIRSCVWLPISKDSIPWTGRSYIWLGDFDTGVLADNITDNYVINNTTNIDIPWPVDDWRRMNCMISLYLPYIGTVTIPVDQCNTASSLKLYWSCEILSGGIIVRVESNTGYTIYIGSGNIGSTYAIGSSNVPISNLVNGFATATTGALEIGGGVFATIANFWDVSGGIDTTIRGTKDYASGMMQMITPVVQCAGSLSSSAAYGQSQQAKITVIYYEPIDDAAFSAIYGHPVMAIGTPVSGYCKTRGFSCGGSMRADEKAGIAYYMDGGTFIE